MRSSGTFWRASCTSFLPCVAGVETSTTKHGKATRLHQLRQPHGPQHHEGEEREPAFEQRVAARHQQATVVRSFSRNHTV